MVAMSRLQVLQSASADAEDLRRQNCAVCPNRSKCWSSSPEFIAENLLVCRIQRGIDENKSIRSLLESLDDKVSHLARRVSITTGLDRAQVRTDLQAALVYNVRSQYKIASQHYLRAWLFGDRHGGVVMAARIIAAKERKEQRAREALLDEQQYVEQQNIDAWAAPEELSLDDDYFAHFMSIADNGRTLSNLEHRVLKFCLLTDGSYTWFAEHTGSTRQDITRIFAVAVNQVLRHMGGSLFPGKSREAILADRRIPAEAAAVELRISIRQVYHLRKRLKESAT